MYKETFKLIKDTIKHWYLLLVLGIIFIIVGMLAIITPVAAYLSLAILFSVTFFVTGVLEIIFSIIYKKQFDSWGWTLASGILDFIIGLILILNPQISIITLPLFVGFVVLYRSMMAIAWSIELKKYSVSNWGWLLFTGILRQPDSRRNDCNSSRFAAVADGRPRRYRWLNLLTENR